MLNDKLVLDYKIGIAFILNNKHKLYLFIDEQEYCDICIRCYTSYDKANEIFEKIVAMQLAQMLICFFASQRIDIKIIDLHFIVPQAEENDYTLAVVRELRFNTQLIKFNFYTALPNLDLSSIEILFADKLILPKVSLLNINYTKGRYNLKNSDFKQQIRKKSVDLYLAIEITCKHYTHCEIILPRSLIYNILRIVLKDEKLEIKYNDFYANLILESISAILPEHILDDLIIKGYKYKKLAVGVYEQINCRYRNKLLGYVLANNLDFLNHELTPVSDIKDEKALIDLTWPVKLPLIIGAVELSNNEFKTLEPGDIVCLDYPLNTEDMLKSSRLIIGDLDYVIDIESDKYTVSEIRQL